MVHKKIKRRTKIIKKSRNKKSISKRPIRKRSIRNKNGYKMKGGLTVAYGIGIVVLLGVLALFIRSKLSTEWIAEETEEIKEREEKIESWNFDIRDRIGDAWTDPKVPLGINIDIEHWDDTIYHFEGKDYIRGKITAWNEPIWLNEKQVEHKKLIDDFIENTLAHPDVSLWGYPHRDTVAAELSTSSVLRNPIILVYEKSGLRGNSLGRELPGPVRSIMFPDNELEAI